MLCSNCGVDFKEVKTNSLDTGFVIKLDQCPKCGGIWFDKYELFQIPLKDAKEVDKLNKSLLRRSLYLKSKLYCPRDSSKLLQYKDYNIPSDLQIDRCKKCGGIWLNMGELSEFKEKNKKKKNNKPNKEVEKLIESYLGKSSKSSVLADVGDFLMTPVNASGGIGRNIGGLADSHEFYKLNIEEKKVLKAASPEKKIETYRNFIREKKGSIKNKQKAVYNTIDGFMTILRVIMQFIIR